MSTERATIRSAWEPSIVRLQINHNRSVLVRQVAACKGNLSTYKQAVVAEMAIFNASPPTSNTQTLFDSIEDYIWKADDKLNFLIALYEYVVDSSQPHFDTAQQTEGEANLIQEIKDKSAEWTTWIGRIKREWFEMSKDMIQRYNDKQAAAERRLEAREQRAENGGAEANAAPVTAAKPKTDASVLKPDILTLEGGVADFTLWVRRLRAWFTGAGYGSEEVYNDQQRKEFFMRFLDSEVNSRFDEVWASNDNKVANLPNLEETLSKVFETEWPLPERRWKCFDFKQGKLSWTSWYAKLRRQFDEAQLDKIDAEALKCLIVVRNTENVRIKEKMLELKGDDLNLTKLAEIGKLWEATHHNHNQGTNGFTGGVNSLQQGENRPHRRQQQNQDIVCFICNYRYHMARECKSDRSKMKCTDCGDNTDFRKKPHNTGARFCPKNRASPAEHPGRGGSGDSKPQSYEKGTNKFNNARRVKADRDNDSDWDPSDYDSGDDDTPTSGARDRASNWCRYVKFYNVEKSEDQTRCVVILGQRSETGHRLATVLAVPDNGSTTSIIDVGLVERNGFT